MKETSEPRVKLNAVDRLVGWFSAGAAFKRTRQRVQTRQLEILHGLLEGHAARRNGDPWRQNLRYEAASRGRRTAGWRAPGTGPNEEILGSLHTLRARSRDLVRSDENAESAVRIHQSNMVGTGILPRVKLPKGDPLRDVARGLVEDHLETTAIDPEDAQNFYSIQSLAARELVEAGEVLIRRRWRRSSDRLPLPFQLQLIEADHLDTDKNETRKGRQIIQGIEYNARGQVAAYWLFPEHPGESSSLRSFVSKRIPARDIAHLKRIDRVGQVRGVPWGAPAMLKIRDSNDHHDAQLLRQKIAACYVGFVHDLEAQDDAVDTADREVEDFEPGTWRHLPPGKDITLARPPGVEGFESFSKITDRKIARGFGVTYEQLTGDYSEVNFSSGRMGWLEFHRLNQVHQWNLLIPQGWAKVWRWFQEAGVVAGRWDAETRIPVRWTPPRREMIDPVKETAGLKMGVRSGFTNLGEVIREAGFDPEELLDEQAEILKILDQLGLVLDSDPRRDKGRETVSKPAEPADEDED